MHEQLFGKYRTPLLVLLAAVGLVLLIGCANIAGAPTGTCLDPIARTVGENGSEGWTSNLVASVADREACLGTLRRLITAEIALAGVLLIGAGLLLRRPSAARHKF